MGALEDLKKRQTSKDRRAIKNKPSYKDEHGVSRVGNILRTLGKTETLGKILNVAGEIATGNWAGAIGVITNSEELTPGDKEVVLKELEKDIVESQEITKRWEADMKSEHWLPKLIRPIVLLNYTILIDIVILNSMWGKPLIESYIPLVMTMGVTVTGGYFALREYGKSGIKKPV
jgi:hypothetical protein|tara:strand:+ start:962 stop:1486 length:525 start_codon:yes stop_codon:yes gene_type:complete